MEEEKENGIKKGKPGDWGKKKAWLLLKKEDKKKKFNLKNKNKNKNIYIYVQKEGKEVLAFKQAQEAWKNKLNTPLLLTNT